VAAWSRPRSTGGGTFDIEMLEDLVLAAVAEAQKRAAELYQAEVRKLASGLPFPFQLPTL